MALCCVLCADWLKAQADVFKGLVNLEDIVPTFVPPQQVNAEVRTAAHTRTQTHASCALAPNSALSGHSCILRAHA